MLSQDMQTFISVCASQYRAPIGRGDISRSEAAKQLASRACYPCADSRTYSEALSYAKQKLR